MDACGAEAVALSVTVLDLRAFVRACRVKPKAQYFAFEHEHPKQAGRVASKGE